MAERRDVGKWFAGFFFFIALAATMVTLQLYQATAEGPAKRALRQAIAALTEIDLLIAQDYDTLQERAGSVERDEALELAEYPISAPLLRDEALGASPEELRALIIDRSANLMYSEGTSVFRDADMASSGAGTFTAAGAVDRSLGFLRGDVHDILAWLTFALGALTLVLAAIFAATCRGFGRLAAAGAVVVTAALPLLLAGVVSRITFELAGGSEAEYVQRELVEIGASLTAIPIRNGIAFTALGAVLVVAGVVCARWSDRREASLSLDADP